MASFTTYEGPFGQMMSVEVQLRIIIWRHAPICTQGMYLLHQTKGVNGDWTEAGGVVYDAVVDDFGNIVRVNP